MLWVIVSCIAMFTKASDGWPISAWPDTAMAFDMSSDYGDGFYGPWSMDYFRGSRFPGFRAGWPYDRYGPYWGGDAVDPFSPYGYGTLDYSGHPRTAEVAKENYIRDNPYGGTEVGIRDSVSMRTGPWRSGMVRSPYYMPPYLPRPGWRGMDRFSNPYAYDYDFPMTPFRRPNPYPMSPGRPSSLRWGGDATYMRR